MNKPAGKIEAATLASAMAMAFAKIEAATKSANNPHFKSKYADLGAVIDAVKPPLIEHGLFFTQRCHPCDNGVSVETVLHHEGGDVLSLGTLFVPANKQDAQGFGSALTYARRYGLMTAFGVPAEDDDGNAAAKSAPRPEMFERIPTQEPAAREKLDGLHTSKTALRKAVGDVIGKIRAATTLDEISAIVKGSKETVDQAKRDWPVLIDGDPNVPEDIGLRGVLAQRKAELAPDSLDFQMLASVLETCATRTDLQALLDKHGAVAESLDGEESRRWEQLYNDKEAAIMALANVSAG